MIILFLITVGLLTTNVDSKPYGSKKCPPNYCDLALNYDQERPDDCELDCHPTQTTTTTKPPKNREATTTTERPCPDCKKCPPDFCDFALNYDQLDCDCSQTETTKQDRNLNCPGPDCPDCPPNFCDLAVNYDMDCNLV